MKRHAGVFGCIPLHKLAFQKACAKLEPKKQKPEPVKPEPVSVSPFELD